MTMEIFEPANIGKCTLNNRLIRSATYEGMCDENGYPQEAYYNLYEALARSGVGAIITGFAYISRNGKAIQPGQAGIDEDEKISYYKRLTSLVHQHNSRIFMQIVHTGRQTMKIFTGEPVVGASSKRSAYYHDKPFMLTEMEARQLAGKFGEAAHRAKMAGFDGIQLHAAHGYLIHQFLHPDVNKRKDAFAIDPDTNIGSLFLELTIDKVKQRCGTDFPLLVKVSGSDDFKNPFSGKQLLRLVKVLENKAIDGIEVSYGTMDFNALNIFRGDFPEKIILAYNPQFRSKGRIHNKVAKQFLFPMVKKKLKSFTPMYNMEYARLVKANSKIPVILVGGFRNGTEIEHAIQTLQIDFISMCRPFIAEPDLVEKLRNGHFISKCCNCNYCAIMCDSNNKTKCYKN